MDLVALKDASTAAANQIHVDTATQQKLGVRLARAEMAELTHDIAAYGTLVPDESAVLRIGPSADGMLMRLHVNRPGQRIERGQLLYEISSQEALDLQYEYIDIQGRGASASKMAEERRVQNRQSLEEARDAAEREQVERNVRQSEEQLASILRPLERDRQRIALRLMQIGFTDAMLDKLAQDKQVLKQVPVRAQRACVVKEVMARPGMTLGHMNEILHCIDPAQAQIEIVLYADQLSWVEDGNALTVEFANGETLETRLTGLHPLVDEATRTAEIHLITGWNVEIPEYMKVGEKLFNLKRMYDSRLGVSRKDDFLPYRFMTLSRKGEDLTNQLPPMGRLLSDYYTYRGWSEDGVPTPGKLEELGLDEL